MNPWDGFTLDDPRSNARNWTQNLDGTWRFAGGHAAQGSDPTVPPPTYGYGGYDPLSSASYQSQPAAAPATAPQPLTAPVPADARWAPAPAAPATAPAAVTDGWGEAPPQLVDQGRYPASGGGGAGTRYDVGASDGDAGWDEPVWGAPATAPPRGSRWNDPQFSRYFAALGASQPERVALIKGLPGSVSGVRPQGVSRPRRGSALPAPAPRTRPSRLRRNPGT